MDIKRSRNLETLEGLIDRRPVGLLEGGTDYRCHHDVLMFV